MSDVFCFPTIREGLGLSALEALACNVPVIASANRGAKSFIINGENGFLCDKASADQFSSAISRLQHDRELYADISCRCSESVLPFTTEMILEKMSDIYK